jgi:hypothetical protein
MIRFRLLVVIFLLLGWPTLASAEGWEWPTPASAEGLDFLSAKLSQQGAGTYSIKTEFIARRPVRISFVRLSCDVFDASNASLGTFQKDYGTVDPTHYAVLITGSYFRPEMGLPSEVDDADHVSCRLASKEDPLPRVDPADIDVELVTIHALRITNRSPFYLSSKTVACTGPDVSGKISTVTYEIGQWGGVFGDPPGYSSTHEMRDSRGRYLGPSAWTGSVSCAVQAVEAMPVPDVL